MKVIGISAIAAFLFLAGGWVLVDSWTRTPYGKLNPKIAVLLKYISIRGIDLFEPGNSIEDARAVSAKGGRILRAAPIPIKHIADRRIPGPGGPIHIRVYNNGGEGSLPVIVYCHGGGWVLGSLDSHDNICRAIAKKAGALVISVDYRLAPEAPYPAAVEDMYAVLVWTRENAAGLGADPDRIILAGDSAGGNLAAVVSIEARRLNGPPIAGQILIYPVTDLSGFNTGSHHDFAKGYYLTGAYMEKFRAFYVPRPQDRLNPRVSPLLATDLDNLPPAMVVTAQFDILRDEGEAYAGRLKAAGVRVRHIRVNGVIHGFLNMDRILSCTDDLFTQMASFIRDIGPTPS